MKLAGITRLDDARLAPFALWTGTLEERCRKAHAMGYRGLELVVRDPSLLDLPNVLSTIRGAGLAIPQLVTGELNIADRLRLMTPSDNVHREAEGRIRSVIEMAAMLDAFVNIGSFRGRFEGFDSRERAYAIALERIGKVADWAAASGVRITLEPINRFEADYVLSAQDGIRFIQELGRSNVGLMLDLFHMNIEDRSIEASLEETMRAGLLWHIHITDSNRLAPGQGHLDFNSITGALHKVRYQEYLSAEINPLPDPDAAAEETATFMFGHGVARPH